MWYLLGHPEDFMNKTVVRALSCAKWSKYVTHIFVDEAHCVLQWGEDTFRPKYRELYQLRSVCTEALFTAVTATATLSTQKEICTLLGMESVTVVAMSGNRANIKYSCLRRLSHSGADSTVESSYASCFRLFADELRNKGQAFPKTIIYTGLKWCGFGHQLVNQTLTESLRVVVAVNQYHAHLPNQVRNGNSLLLFF